MNFNWEGLSSLFGFCTRQFYDIKRLKRLWSGPFFFFTNVGSLEEKINEGLDLQKNQNYSKLQNIEIVPAVSPKSVVFN